MIDLILKGLECDSFTMCKQRKKNETKQNQMKKKIYLKMNEMKNIQGLKQNKKKRSL